MENMPLLEADSLLIKYILELNEGAVIQHSEIEELIYMKSGNPKYYSFMRQIDRQLLNYNKSLKVVKGVGYRILGAEAIVDKALKMVQSSESKVSNALTLINKIDKDTLNEEYKMKFELVQHKFIQVHANLAGGVKELILIDKPKKNKLLNGGIK